MNYEFIKKVEEYTQLKIKLGEHIQSDKYIDFLELLILEVFYEGKVIKDISEGNTVLYKKNS